MRVGLLGAGRIGALHAETLVGLAPVEALLVADADPARAGQVASKVGDPAVAVAGAADVFDAGVDAVVVATPTFAHADLVCAAVRARVPVFCEKPVALDVAGTRAVLDRAVAAGVPLQVGFQRRFDAGCLALRGAVRSGRLGWLHTVRSCTSDPAPPAASYLATSGGIFRDCGVHDYDAVRWVTGREVVRVFATGANRGADFFAAAGDVDTAVAVLTLDDGTLAVCTATRYNGAGYDVRLEACGSTGTMVAGLDERSPLVPAGRGPGWPVGQATVGPTYASFADRFRDAYAAQLSTFLDVAAGRADNPCDGAEALEALLVAEAAELSRRECRPVTVEEVRA
jgi:myo-inositol 2-dehydrogenase/D-chiro-inositol 1-dehydrogenase